MSGYITTMAPAEALSPNDFMEIVQLSPDVRIEVDTISALASDNSFNDTGDGFVAAGFEVGDRVAVFGFVTEPSNNIFVGVVSDLTAGKLTIGGTDGDVIADEAAGETITIAKWVSRRVQATTVGAGGGFPVQEWAPNFTADGSLYIPADEAMTISQGNAAIGTGTLTYEKSTNATPGTFSSTTLPATLEAGAWLRVIAASVSGFCATHLVRTA